MRVVLYNTLEERLSIASRDMALRTHADAILPGERVIHDDLSVGPNGENQLTIDIDGPSKPSPGNVLLLDLRQRITAASSTSAKLEILLKHMGI